ncbi:MAG: DUF1549 and DUF1553 domain-containing protein [Leptospirales bacterium]|nr:DUF1549 and DUF1553 domain-containing protein [Leptospirales bacterium]
MRTITIASVLAGALTLAFVVAASLQANDQHPLDAVYQQATGKHPQTAAPAAILRRMSLQLRGSIPRLAELQDFEGQPDDAQRRYAIAFLRDPEFAEYWGSYLASLFRDRTQEKNSVYGGFQRYLSQSLHENKPYNQMAVEMITASGSPEQNPAAGFYLRDDADPLQIAEYAGRLFYGRKVQCARCHDHPYQPDFKRRDYYGLAAFFSQTYASNEYYRDWEQFAGRPWLPGDRRNDLSEEDRKLWQEKEREFNREVLARLSDQQKRDRRQAARLPLRTIFYDPGLGLRYPTSDLEPGGDLVEARYPDGTRAVLRPGQDRRAAFAAWLTAPENVRFRKVIINRIWHRLMGWSFFEPFDDWNQETEMRSPELLDHLEKAFLARGFRIKDLILYIVSSEAYARSAPPPNAADSGDVQLYFQPQRLDADQLMNSLIRAAQAAKVSELRERASLPPAAAAQSDTDLSGVGTLRLPIQNNRDFVVASQVPRPADYSSFHAVFGAGPRIDIDDDDRTLTIEQILTLINGRLTGRLAWEFAGADTLFKAEFDRSGMEGAMNLTFRSALSRNWTPEEKQSVLRLVQGRLARPQYDQAALQDLLWALFNSMEFQHVN